jgi:signal transduction histidine kinase
VRSSRSREPLAIVVAAATLLCVLLVVVLDRLLRNAGRADLAPFDVESIPYLVTIATSTGTGVLIAVRRPAHPVGWLFLALGLSIALGGVLDSYGRYGAVARPGSVPAAELAAVLGDGIFLVWFVLIALILHLTPTGSALTPRWRQAATTTVVAGTLAYSTVLFWPGQLDDAALNAVRSPLALPGSWEPAFRVVRTTLAILTAVGLVLAAMSLVVRFLRSRGTERRQLLWLAIAVVPMPAFVGLAFWAAPDHPVTLSFVTAGFIGLVPIAAGLSIVRYQLYAVDRILSRAVTYLLVSALLAVTFSVIVTAAGQAIGDRAGGSSIPAVLGTLGAVAVAAPAYRGFQQAIDRRFNRRRYDALTRVQDYVHDPDPGVSVEEVLRQALRVPTLEVMYLAEDGGHWVLADGRHAEPAQDDVPVTRQGRPVARLRAEEGIDRELVRSVAGEATPELENAMLRARISLQLAEVRESRSRIAAASLAERRRLERNLHDGAQQRLLALALELRAAQVNGTAQRLQEAVVDGIGALQAAVVELRELANGLHPAILQDAGLGPAIEDLATRLPVHAELGELDRRFHPEIEAAAWFIACEGAANAVKHADARRIDLVITARDGVLRVRVTDDGCGGADPRGSGLRGIADRTEALGGRLSVYSDTSAGTTLIGELPCGS